MRIRPSLPADLVAPATPSRTIEPKGLFGVDTVRAVLERLSKAADDASSAMSLLLVLRTFALEHGGAGLVVEMSSVDIGILVTLEDREQDFWVAEMLPLSLRTVKSLLEDMPELLLAFEKSETPESLSLRVPSLGFDLTSRMTPVALPSIGLLLEAGLLTRRVAAPADDQS